VFLAVPSAFEIFGVDFLLDEAGTPWLLEANAAPDLVMTGERLRPLVNGLGGALSPSPSHRAHKQAARLVELRRIRLPMLVYYSM